MPTNLAVVGQDPRFGGGARVQLDAFLQAAAGLVQRCELHYVIHPGLPGPIGPPGGIPGAPGRLGQFVAANEIFGARRLAPRLREPDSLWVVSTVASAGSAAILSGRPYSCWIGTGLADESRSRRRGGLSVSRSLALRVNAPFLLSAERRVLRRAQAVFATSPASQESIAAAGGLPLDRVGIMPIPIDIDRFRPPADRAADDPPVIVFVGRGDDPRKNVRLLLAAVPEIRRKVPGTRVRLIGRRPTIPLPDGVEAVGEVPSIVEELQSASLFVLPSLQEGFGVVTAEALACGVPVLSTPCGGPEHLIRSSGGGRVLETFDSYELAQTAVELLQSPDTLAAMSGAGRTFVEREHSPARFQERLARVLAGLDPDG